MGSLSSMAILLGAAALFVFALSFALRRRAHVGVTEDTQSATYDALGSAAGNATAQRSVELRNRAQEEEVDVVATKQIDAAEAAPPAPSTTERHPEAGSACVEKECDGTGAVVSAEEQGAAPPAG